MLKGARVLVTGGTGSFGQAFVQHVLASHEVGELIVFSRDEFKQHTMAQRWPVDAYPIRYFLGDIRDKERLLRAFTGVDFVIHAAALKQVPALEENPIEAIRTNIVGAQNVVEAALERGVRRVVAISTDKAVNPVNLYGATKLAMEKLVLAANAYVRYRDVRFSAVRYGNVVGSRGSVILLFSNLIAQGERVLPVTDPAMTRFWITLEQGVALVLRALGEAQGGEVFVPKIPSMSVGQLLAAMPVECSSRIIGRRPGEKVHEVLIGEDEGTRTYDCGDHYVIAPDSRHYEPGAWAANASRVTPGFRYASDTNSQWVSAEEMRELVTSLAQLAAQHT
jgi:UDP-N-acetylglucosamine 4,6-dehydratase